MQELMTRHGLLFDPNDRVKALRGLRPRIPRCTSGCSGARLSSPDPFEGPRVRQGVEMIDLELIRRDPERVRAALLKRMDEVDLETILDLDSRKRELMVRAETARARRNELGGQIGRIRSQGGVATEARGRDGRSSRRPSPSWRRRLPRWTRPSTRPWWSCRTCRTTACRQVARRTTAWSTCGGSRRSSPRSTITWSSALVSGSWTTNAGPSSGAAASGSTRAWVRPWNGHSSISSAGNIKRRLPLLPSAPPPGDRVRLYGRTVSKVHRRRLPPSHLRGRTTAVPVAHLRDGDP